MVKVLPHSKYFEGTLQLRDVGEEFVEKALHEIEQSGRAQIAKVKPQPRGVDIYLSDAHYTLLYAKKLRDRYGGDLVTSRKLFTLNKNTNKLVWRVTALFRKLPFKVGDIIHLPEGDVKILSTGARANVQFLVGGRKKSLRFDELSRFVEKDKDHTRADDA